MKFLKQNSHKVNTLGWNNRFLGEYSLTEGLISNRCITPNNSESGQFIIKGSGGLPNHPNTSHIPQYPTEDVQPLPNDDNAPTWQKGDPIIEPQGVYRSPEGRIFLSRDCS